MRFNLLETDLKADTLMDITSSIYGVVPRKPAMGGGVMLHAWVDQVANCFIGSMRIELVAYAVRQVCSVCKPEN